MRVSGDLFTDEPRRPGKCWLKTGVPQGGARPPLRTKASTYGDPRQVSLRQHLLLTGVGA
jgi:hypothetical protein